MTVYTLTYNEELMLPFFIKHYRDRFPGCNIVVYDNESSDRTVQIAQDNGCKVIMNCTGGKLDDLKYLEIKNNCWKSEKGWVIIADCDELLDIWSEDLEREKNATLIKGHGINMVNLNNNLEIENINHGVRAPSYDKIYGIHAGKIREINYAPGAHHANPSGELRCNRHQYICRHYKYIDPDYMIARHKSFAQRLSDVNMQMGYGGHYLYTEQQIRAEFEQARKEAILI